MDGPEVMLIDPAPSAENLPVPRSEAAAPPARPPSRNQMLKDWQRRVMTARLAVLAEIERMGRAAGRTRTQAVEAFVALARGGRLDAHMQGLLEQANHKKGKNGRKVSPRTIHRWFSLRKQHGSAGLAPADTGKLEPPPWAEEFLYHYRQFQKPSIPAALERMGERAPSYASAVRFVRKFSRLDAQRGRMSGSELRSVRGYVVRDKRHLLPLDVVVADGHSFKAKVAHPVHGKPFTPEVEGIIDVATRVCTGWSAGLAESAQVVADAVRHAVTVDERKPYGGCFAIFYSDRGSGNKAHVISDEVTGILARIGATPKDGIPGNPQGRGVVEKMQGSLWITAAKELPTFCGKGMDALAFRRTMKLVERDIKERGVSDLLISWRRFLDFCQYAVDCYNNRPHSALPRITDPATGRRRRMTPAEMWRKFEMEGWKPVLIEERGDDVRDLFRPQTRCVTRRGTVTLFTNTYYHKELEHWHGETVIVGYDIHDPEAVQVRDTRQRLICEARWNANSRDYFPKAVVEQARQRRMQGRLKRKEAQIAEIREEGTGVVDVSIPEEALCPAPSFVSSPPGGEGEGESRPIFQSNAERYEWHMERGVFTEEDDAWVAWFRTTGEYRMLYDAPAEAEG